MLPRDLLFSFKIMALFWHPLDKKLGRWCSVWSSRHFVGPQRICLPVCALVFNWTSQSRIVSICFGLWGASDFGKEAKLAVIGRSKSSRSQRAARVWKAIFDFTSYSVRRRLHAWWSFTSPRISGWMKHAFLGLPVQNKESDISVRALFLTPPGIFTNFFLDYLTPNSTKDSTEDL